MESLPSIFWNHYLQFSGTTTLNFLEPLPLILWNHYPQFSGTTTLNSLESLPSIFWNHYPQFSGTTTLNSLEPLPSILWNQYPQFKTVSTGKSVSTYVVSTNVSGHDTDCDVTSRDSSFLLLPKGRLGETLDPSIKRSSFFPQKCVPFTFS